MCKHESDGTIDQPVELFFLPIITGPSSRGQRHARSKAIASSHVAKIANRRRQISRQVAAVSETLQSLEELRHEAQSDKSSCADTSGEAGSSQYGSHLSTISKSASALTLPSLYMNAYSTLSGPSMGRVDSRLLHHAVNVFYPAFDPGTGRYHTPAFATDWNALISAGTDVFHGVMWQVAINLSFLTKQPITEREALIHHQITVEQVAKAIRGPIDSIKESTIYAIVNLTIPEKHIFEPYIAAHDGFHPPFADLGWVNIFTRRPIISIHSKAVYRLTELRGGIDFLQVNCFAAIVVYLDLIEASQSLRRPCVGWPAVIRKATEHLGYRDLLSFANECDDKYGLSVDRCRPSDALGNFAAHGVSVELREVIKDTRTWMRLLTTYENDHSHQLDLSTLLILRNQLQHRILCTIGPGETLYDDLDYHQDHSLGQSCDMNGLFQTALIIFAVGNVFPTVYAGPYKALSKRLEYQITLHLTHLSTPGMRKILVWLCMLGYLCAAHVCDEVTKDVFIDLLIANERRIAVSDLNIDQSITETEAAGMPDKLAHNPRSWAEIKRTCLMPYLWHSKACDFGGESAWNLVQWKLQTSV